MLNQAIEEDTDVLSLANLALGTEKAVTVALQQDIQLRNGSLESFENTLDRNVFASVHGRCCRVVDLLSKWPAPIEKA